MRRQILCTPAPFSRLLLGVEIFEKRLPAFQHNLVTNTIFVCVYLKNMLGNSFKTPEEPHTPEEILKTQTCT